jgi:hypothetical protein
VQNRLGQADDLEGRGALPNGGPGLRGLLWVGVNQ